MTVNSTAPPDITLRCALDYDSQLNQKEAYNQLNAARFQLNEENRLKLQEELD